MLWSESLKSQKMEKHKYKQFKIVLKRMYLVTFQQWKEL